MSERGRKPAGKRMKGQFFLLGAFFLLLVFYLGVSAFISPSSSRPDIQEEISALSENIENEYPRAFNLGLNSSSPAAVLVNFSGLAMNAAESRGAELKILWIFTANNSENLNVTVGNFLGFPLNITLNVSGTVKEMQVDDGGINSEVFASPPSEFELRANFNTSEKNLLLEKYKANLYTFMEMTKGNDVIISEAKA